MPKEQFKSRIMNKNIEKIKIHIQTMQKENPEKARRVQKALNELSNTPGDYNKHINLADALKSVSQPEFGSVASRIDSCFNNKVTLVI